MASVLELSGVRLRLATDHDVSSLLADVSPPIGRFDDEGQPVDWTLRLVADASVRPEARPRRTWYLADGIGDLMASWASIREWDDRGVELVYHDDVAGVTCRITSDFAQRCTTVTGPPGPVNRRPLRLIRLFFGHRLLRAGWTPLHAASFVVDGAGVLCCGGPGAGKSTIAFLATALGGAEFLADDVSLVRGAPGPRVIGWPTTLQSSGFGLRSRTRRPCSSKRVQSRASGARGSSYSMPRRSSAATTSSPPSSMLGGRSFRAGTRRSRSRWNSFCTQAGSDRSRKPSPGRGRDPGAPSSSSSRQRFLPKNSCRNSLGSATIR